jgi:hypothetical protein
LIKDFKIRSKLQSLEREVLAPNQRRVKSSARVALRAKKDLSPNNKRQILNLSLKAKLRLSLFPRRRLVKKRPSKEDLRAKNPKKRD